MDYINLFAILIALLLTIFLMCYLCNREKFSNQKEKIEESSKLEGIIPIPNNQEDNGYIVITKRYSRTGNNIKQLLNVLYYAIKEGYKIRLEPK